MSQFPSKNRSTAHPAIFRITNSLLPRPVPISKRTLPFPQCWNASPISSEAYAHRSSAAGASSPVCPNGTIASGGTTSTSGTPCTVPSPAFSHAVRAPTASGTFPSAVSGRSSGGPFGTSARTMSCGASVKSSHTVSCGVSGFLSGSMV